MRTAAACAIVAALSIYAIIEQFYRTRVFNTTFADPYEIGSSFPRYGPVAGLVPEDAVIGYVSNRSFDNPEGGAFFFGAQYVLAPRILIDWDEVQDGQFVLGNFVRPEDLRLTIDQSAKLYGLRVVRELQGGVVLYRKGMFDQ